MGGSRIQTPWAEKTIQAVTSTTYTKLIAQFFGNLLFYYTRPGVLFSSVQDKNIEWLQPILSLLLSAMMYIPREMHSWMSSRHLSTF